MDSQKAWSDATFGKNSRNISISFHIQKEAKELTEALVYLDRERTEKNLADAKEEFADCLILLLDAASHTGLTAENLMEEVIKKFNINKRRTWGKPDANGVVEHIK